MPIGLGKTREGEGPAAHRRAGPSLPFFSLLLALALSGCGIEEYVYFYPPTTASSPVKSITPLDFGHNASNQYSSSFLGYEVYYLLIDVDNETFLNSVNSKIDSYIESKTPSEMISIIKSLGFVPLIGLKSDGTVMTQVPLFRLSDATLDIDFSVYIGESGAVSISGDSTSSVVAPAYIRRNSKDNSGNYRSFADLTQDEVASDGDTVYLTEKPDKVLFRAYIVAYGVNGNTWTEVYSKAARVGHYTSTTDYGVEISGTFGN